MLLRLDFSDMIKNSSGSGEQQHTNKGKGGRLRNPDKVTQLSLDTRARSAWTLSDVWLPVSRGKWVAASASLCTCLWRLRAHRSLNVFSCFFFIAHHQSFNVGRLRLKQNTLASPCQRVKSESEFIAFFSASPRSFTSPQKAFVHTCCPARL